ncbi:RNA polymerase-associated protein rtf1 [Clonorchis sinensis]|uniref:RNA polymerase-associated protein rtf1 n=1 Tax=Clonorchis sinensis TaxID=79923 RepID=A0A3R7G1U8_CLOSI|nr:RNA polymerase-associated protein rtf1 [Clonorchis sinensis]
MSTRFSPNGSYSTDSDDEEEWSQMQRKSKKKKHHPKMSRVEKNVVNLEEGEISSDELDDDEDDGLDENLIGGEDDKRKLEKMSEKEREEELFRRAERRDAIQARRAVKQKLKEKRDRERAEKASNSTAVDSQKQKRQSAYANVFSSDSDEGENTDSSGVGPRGLRQRKLALEKKKEAHSHKFNELIERRRQQAAKKRRMQSGSEDETAARTTTVKRSSGASSSSESETDEKGRKSKDSRGKHGATSMSQRIFSDESDSTDSSRPGARPQARRASLSSSTGSQQSGSSSEDDARGRSRSPEESLVSSVEQLSRIRLSRFKLEKWVHMPFFDSLVKGCFVRINIGLNQGVAVYRCAEIVDIIETPKIYDLGETRTNKGMVVRVGKDQGTFRLAFVSNSDFLPAEFESWLRRISDANMKPPTLAFVSEKAAQIQDAINKPIKDEHLVEQIIQSKKRFQRAPTNFALRKAELLKQREQAEVEGDTLAIQRIDAELEDIETQAERIDRRRTMGFKSITSINQRNRILSVQQAEEAIRRESREAQKSKEEDPFTRVHSQPVIVTKKYLEQLRHKRINKDAQGDSQVSLDSTANDGSNPGFPNSASTNMLLTPTARIPSTPGQIGGTPFPNTAERVKWTIEDEPINLSTPQDSLHAIHNFEIHIDLDLDGAGDQPSFNDSRTTPSKPKGLDHDAQSFGGGGGGAVNDTRDSRNGISTPTLPTGPGTGSARRLLNLQEYKKRLGLI